MSNNVKKYRLKNGLKMSDMAKLLDISVPNYQKKETGSIKFTLVEAYSLAKYFKTTIEELFFKQ